MDQHRVYPEDWRAVQRENGSIFFESGNPAGKYVTFDVATDDWGLAIRFVAAMNFYNHILRESKDRTGPTLLREEQMRKSLLPDTEHVSLGKRIGDAIRAATKMRTTPLEVIGPEITLRELAQICRVYSAYFFLSDQGTYQLKPNKDVETPDIAKGTIEP